MDDCPKGVGDRMELVRSEVDRDPILRSQREWLPVTIVRTAPLLIIEDSFVDKADGAVALHL